MELIFLKLPFVKVNIFIRYVEKIILFDFKRYGIQSIYLYSQCSFCFILYIVYM